MSNQMQNSSSNLPAAIADLFTVDATENDLSGGVTGGFAIVSIRGSKWRIKYQGSEEPVVNEDGDPKASLEVVMVDASPNLSKIYYAQSYTEGDAETPDCSSVNGDVPDQGVPNKQAENCATCPHNQWGSRITENGKKAKACHDSRRIAVVPSGDLRNEVYGGPMLLRIPAASLADLKTFDGQLRSKGISYRTIVVRLGFDMNTSYPRLTFKAVRRLKPEELEIIAEHITSGEAGRILESTTEAKTSAPEQSPPAKGDTAPAEGTTEEDDDDMGLDNLDEQEEKPARTTKKKVSKKKSAKKSASKEPEEKPTQTSDIDDELDDILGDLDNLG